MQNNLCLDTSEKNNELNNKLNVKMFESKVTNYNISLESIIHI